MLVLLLESSCDETACAVVKDGREVLASVVASQVALHAPYGGVVPEIASRAHLESITPVVRQALDQANVSLNAIDGIGVTRGPGLLGALLVGVGMAKALAYAHNLPLIGLHHLEGHLLAGGLEGNLSFPFLGLVISGGHTHLYRVDGIGRYRTLGRTIDDAVGEAFDKTASLLGLSYPGGALIDRLATTGDASLLRLPRPLIRDASLNFSFSGLKTAVYTHCQKTGGPPKDSDGMANMAASFQEAVCDVLVHKTERALEQEKLQHLVLGGGVACNSGVRKAMAELAAQKNISLVIPSPALCADNAAMLGVAADYYLGHGRNDMLTMDAVATWPLDRVGFEGSHHGC